MSGQKEEDETMKDLSIMMRLSFMWSSSCVIWADYDIPLDVVRRQMQV
jgi:hypothetical protein